LGTMLNRVHSRDGHYASYYWPHEADEHDPVTEPGTPVQNPERR
jgi:hypothetical protein